MTTPPLAWIVVWLVLSWFWFCFAISAYPQHSAGTQVFASLICFGAPATALIWALKAIFMP